MTGGHDEPRPWKAAALWLAFLGPFFFLVYGFTNGLTAQRADVPSFYFDWEQSMPFVPQLMLPYMSIDLFFAASMFLCVTRRELDRHAWRIIAAIIISATGFLLFPLQFAFERPPVDGFNGFLIEVLTGFDKPFNQAPSLHISLLMLLWVVYVRHLSGLWRRLIHVWFVLIGLSVVLVYQHHVIDVFSGFTAGIICFYLFPDEEWKIAEPRLTTDPIRRKIGWRYTSAGGLFLAAAVFWQGWAWLLLWPAAALLVVAAGYLLLGAGVFQKHHGRHSFAARWLLAPYLFGAWLSYRFFTRGHPAMVAVTDDLYLGRLPRAGETGQAPWHSVVDLTAEFSSSITGEHYYNLPLLDLTVPDAPTLRQAVQLIERARQVGPVLVHCALGASRSAVAVIAWMIQHGHARDIAQAESMIAGRWRTVLTPAHRAVLAEALG